MHIKVRMLLPREVDEKGEVIDPRADLIKALLEYKRYKEVSEEFSFLETNQRKINNRGNFTGDIKEAPPEFDILLKNVTVFDLAKAFKKAIEGIKKVAVHEIKKMPVSIDEQIDFIMEKVNEMNEIHFLTLVSEIREKIRLVVTFIALLELTKMNKIGLKESSNFNDFVLFRITNG
jgi:segregation and condensation protein A